MITIRTKKDFEGMDKAHGVFSGLTNDEYHSAKGYSRSDILTILRSPGHWKYAKAHPSHDTAALAFGNAFHTLILEPDVFPDRYAMEPKDAAGNRPDKRTKDGKALWAEWEAANAGKGVISPADMEALEGMRDALFSHPEARQYSLESHLEMNELSIFSANAGLDGPLKCRPDRIAGNVVLDVKTTKNAETDEIKRDALKYGYDIQAYLYLAITRQVGLNVSPRFAFVEKTAPFGVKFYRPDSAFIDHGRQRVHRAIDIIQDCLQSGEWPVYGSEEETLSLPAWALRSYKEAV